MIDDFFHSTAHPEDLLSNDQFSEAVELLKNSSESDTKLLEYGTGANPVISCIALEALNRREPEKALLDKLTAELNKLYLWPLYFALRALRQESYKPDIGAFLVNVQDWWLDAGLLPQFVESFIRDKRSQGIQLKIDDALKHIHPEQIDKIASFIDLLSANVGMPLLNEINKTRERQVVWFIPGFHELLHTGQHRYSPSDVLDMLLPHIESGTILIIGETLPESYEMLLK